MTIVLQSLNGFWFKIEASVLGTESEDFFRVSVGLWQVLNLAWSHAALHSPFKFPEILLSEIT
jgi:hypothetical protein